MNKRIIIAELNKIANELDSNGLYSEANTLTNVMKRVAQLDYSKIPEYVLKAGVPGALGLMAADYFKLTPEKAADHIAKTTMPVPYMAAKYLGQLAGQPKTEDNSNTIGSAGQMAANPNTNLNNLTGVGLTPRQLLQAQQTQQQKAQQQKQQRGASAQDWINANSNLVGGDVNKLISNANQALKMGGMGKDLHNDIMYILNLRTNKGLGAVRENDANKQPSPTMGLA